jgi:hypothetical protein
MNGKPMEANKMTELVPTRKGKTGQTSVSLAEIQNLLDARNVVAETRTPTSTRKARIEEAKRNFDADPAETVDKIYDLASQLSIVFDEKITPDSVPLTRDQVRKLSDEYLRLDHLKAQIAALETRYRDVIFSHLDETLPKVPGRPAAQVPGKVEAEGSGARYVFERRGGNRANPTLNTEGLRAALPAHLADQIFVTVHRPAVAAYDEEVFDEATFGRLVDEGKIDLDTVAEHLTPGEWRTPSFYKTLVEGE